MKQALALYNHLLLQPNNGLIDTFFNALIIVDQSRLI